MRGHGAKFSRKMEEAVAALLTQRNHEEAARAVGIGTATLLRWQKEPEFQQAYRAAHGQSIARLQQATSAAVSTLLKVMVDASTPASTKVRAADSVLNHSAKAIELARTQKLSNPFLPRRQGLQSGILDVLSLIRKRHRGPRGAKPSASTRVRAAEIIVSHAAKAIEIEDIEARVAELERAAGMGVHRLEHPYPRLGALPAGK